MVSSSGTLIVHKQLSMVQLFFHIQVPIAHHHKLQEVAEAKLEQSSFIVFQLSVLLQVLVSQLQKHHRFVQALFHKEVAPAQEKVVPQQA